MEKPRFEGKKKDVLSHSPAEDVRLGFGDEMAGDLVRSNETLRRNYADFSMVESSKDYKRSYKLFEKNVGKWFAKFEKSADFSDLKQRHSNVMEIVDLQALALAAALPAFQENALKVHKHNIGSIGPKWGYGMGVSDDLMRKLFVREVIRLQKSSDRNAERYVEKMAEKERVGGRTVDVKNLSNGIYWALQELFDSGVKGTKSVSVYIRGIKGIPLSRSLELKITRWDRGNGKPDLRFSMMGDIAGYTNGYGTYNVRDRYQREDLVANMEKWVVAEVVPRIVRGSYGPLDEYLYT